MDEIQVVYHIFVLNRQCSETRLQMQHLLQTQLQCQQQQCTVLALYSLALYISNQPPKANSIFHPSGVGKWVPASAGKAKAGMVQSVSGCKRGVQVKLWDPLRTRAIPERLRGAFTTRCYTNPRLPLPLPYIHSLFIHCVPEGAVHKLGN